MYNFHIIYSIKYRILIHSSLLLASLHHSRYVMLSNFIFDSLSTDCRLLLLLNLTSRSDRSKEVKLPALLGNQDRPKEHPTNRRT